MAFQKHCIHAILQCENCEWGSEDYVTAQAEAGIHVRTTGHTVRGEIGYSATYSPSTAALDHLVLEDGS